MQSARGREAAPAQPKPAMAALLGSAVTGLLLDEQASTAHRVFEGSAAERVAHAKMLVHTEAVPECVRLTFADKFYGLHHKHSAGRAPSPGAAEEWAAEELLDAAPLDAAHHDEPHEVDALEAPLDTHPGHEEALHELNAHAHAAAAPRRKGRRRTHAMHTRRRLHSEHVDEPLHNSTAAAPHDAAARAREGWRGGGVDGMMSLLEEYSAVADEVHDEEVTPGPRPPSLQGRVVPPAARTPVPRAAGMAAPAAATSGAPRGAPPGAFAMPTGPTGTVAQVAAHAAQRALRRLGLLETAPEPHAGAADAAAPAGGGLGRAPAWQTEYVDGVLEQFGLGKPRAAP